jgi:hypothetical protein
MKPKGRIIVKQIVVRGFRRNPEEQKKDDSSLFSFTTTTYAS